MTVSATRATFSERIVAYLRGQMPQATELAISGLYRIPGGASRETWSFDATWLDAAGQQRRGFILRRDPEAGLLETERDVEYRVYRAFQDSAVPVPHVYWLELNAAPLERPFFIMERIDGCQTEPRGLTARPDDAARQQIARRKFEILGAIHAADPAALDLLNLDVSDPPQPEACAERELAHWERIIDAQALEPLPVIRLAISWLRANPPPPAQRVVVCHGDFRTGNFLYTADDIRGVLDWEMVHLGDPLEDLAWTCLKNWQLGARRQADGMVEPLIGGIATREEAFAIYAAASGIQVDMQALRWWEVFSHVKATAIWITGGRSFIDGRTSEPLMGLIPRIFNGFQFDAILDLIGW
ncbi:MAG: phosphotransferase family protein [Dehalococcoidia bacterium]